MIGRLTLGKWNHLRGGKLFNAWNITKPFNMFLRAAKWVSISVVWLLSTTTWIHPFWLLIHVPKLSSLVVSHCQVFFANCNYLSNYFIPNSIHYRITTHPSNHPHLCYHWPLNLCLWTYVFFVGQSFNPIGILLSQSTPEAYFHFC